VDVEAVRVGCLAPRGAVEDALSREPVEPLRRELPPRDAAGEDDRLRAHDVAAVEMHVAVRRVDARDRPRHDDLGTEPARLLQRTARELVSGDARRESEVVLDTRRRAGLPARSFPLDDDRPQALRGAVHGRGETRRPAPDDDRVVLGHRRLRLQPQQLRDTAELRLHDCLPIDHADRRQVGVGRHRASPLLVDVRLVCLEPLERDPVAVEKAAQLAARRIELASEHDRARRRRLGGDALQPPRSREPVARKPCDLLRDAGRDRRDCVVVVRLDSHHSRRLGSAEPDRIRRAERDRNLADDVAGASLADEALDAVDDLDHVDVPVEKPDQRRVVALVRGVLTRCKADVGRGTGEALARRRLEVGEDLDSANVVCRQQAGPTVQWVATAR
jgi:hypothetical protein